MDEISFLPFEKGYFRYIGISAQPEEYQKIGGEKGEAVSVENSVGD